MPMTQIEILRAACCIAGLDGKVCEREKKMLDKLAAHVGAGRASLNAMIQRAETDHTFYEEMFDDLRADAEKAIRVLLCMAAADGVVSLEQRVVMGMFASRLGMSDERYDKLLRAVEKQLAEKQGKAKPEKSSSKGSGPKPVIKPLGQGLKGSAPSPAPRSR